MVILNDKISLEPKYFDKNIENHLLNKLKKKLIGSCSLDEGYIIKIKKIINIGENIITSANSITVFDLTFDAETLKPHVGLVLCGKIWKNFEEGIFMNILNKMKIVILKESLTKQNFEYRNNCFCRNNLELNIGDEIDVEILMINYDKNNFRCIGKLVS